jgi:hypothetical protein
MVYGETQIPWSGGFTISESANPASVPISSVRSPKSFHEGIKQGLQRYQKAHDHDRYNARELAKTRSALPRHDDIGILEQPTKTSGAKPLYANDDDAVLCAAVVVAAAVGCPLGAAAGVAAVVTVAVGGAV